MKYGLPYKGSKNKLAEKIVDLFPSATNFYDLFCGGCSITHRALLENRWENYIINDLSVGLTQLFIDCIKGKYHNFNKWVSREEFKNSNDYGVKIMFSFGNNCRDYLYSKELEPIKKAWHYAIFFNDFKPMKKLLNIDLSPIENIKDKKEKYLKSKAILKNDSGQQLQSLQNLERLERLENLERLQNLERLERLSAFNTSYENIEIKKDSVIYCDIPYINTEGYNVGSFNYENFYNWCEGQKELTFISSYEMPVDRFYTVETFEHRSTMPAVKENQKIVEKLFIPKTQIDLYNSKKCTLF